MTDPTPIAEDAVILDDAIDWPDAEIGEVPEEILEPVDEEQALEQLFAQMNARANQPEPERPYVERYWLSDFGYINVALITQDGNAAILVNDGDNTIAVFDSHQTDSRYLNLLASVVDAAIDAVEGN
jgi:hypothetical protein